MNKPEQIEAVFLTTHNWGKSAKFFQALGFTLEFETDHNSGQLRNGDGPYLFIAEIPASEPPKHRSSSSCPTNMHSAPSPSSTWSRPSKTRIGAPGR